MLASPRWVAPALIYCWRKDGRTWFMCGPGGRATLLFADLFVVVVSLLPILRKFFLLFRRVDQGIKNLLTDLKLVLHGDYFAFKSRIENSRSSALLLETEAIKLCDIATSQLYPAWQLYDPNLHKLLKPRQVSQTLLNKRPQLTWCNELNQTLHDVSSH